MRLMLTMNLIFLSMSVASFASSPSFYRDLAEYSPSGKYKVEAKSPDNKLKRRTPFQKNFVYTCMDAESGKVYWTRNQPMGEPVVLSSGRKIDWPREASPIDLVVSDDGWAAIRTVADNLTFVDPNGVDRAKVSLYEDAISEEELEEFGEKLVVDVCWDGYSLWYFLPSRPVFVIRPWWGRRIFVDIETGRLIAETPAITKSAVAYETAYVLSNLDRATKEDIESENVWPVLYAAYLAGPLGVTDAIPALQTLEVSSYAGRTTFGLVGNDEFDGEVDPQSYSTHTLRQVVQLSLRRLGTTPKPLPIHTFNRDGKSDEPFPTLDLHGPRHKNADQVKVGMTAKQVLNLIGSPDFIGSDIWSYDMDSDMPYSLNVTFDEKNVVKLTRNTTPIWKSGLLRDKALVH